MNLRRKPNGVWLVDYEDPETGARRRVSTGLTDKSEAMKKARDIILGLDTKSAKPRAPGAGPAGKSSGFTMADLFRKCELTVWSPRECKSQATVRSNLKYLSAKLGDELVTDMTYSRLEKLAEDMFAEGLAAGTVKRKLDMVSKALTMATKWTDEAGRPYLMGKPAFPQITARNQRDRVLEPKEEAAVFVAIAERRLKEPTRDWRRFGILIRWLLDTGCRLGEALNVRDTFLEEEGTGNERTTFVTFPRYTTKNDKPRRLPLTSAIEAELQYLKMAAIDGRLFPLKPATVWYMWDNIRGDLKAKGYDLSDVVLHTMRHTCGTRLAKSLPIHKVSLWLGHSSVQVTMDHYMHLQSTDFLDAKGVLEAHPLS